MSGAVWRVLYNYFYLCLKKQKQKKNMHTHIIYPEKSRFENITNYETGGITYVHI